MQDLFLELKEKMNKLDSALSAFGKRGKERAEAERAYRMALAEAMLKERVNGTPVSILSDICKGKEEVAELKLKRDVAETVYDSAKEACNIFKLEVRVIEEAIEREWHSQ